MPYIAEKDKLRLDPLIENLRVKAVMLADFHVEKIDAIAGYMRYVARRVLVETALNAAEQYQGKRETRYWLIVDHAGIASNIAFELFDRVLSREPDIAKRFDFRHLKLENMPLIPADAFLLNAEIDALIQEIARIGGPEGYNYHGAYCGMVNYSLTELVPRMLLFMADASNISFDWFFVALLINFWLGLARELYVTVARQYEDEQIEKNGDVDVYKKLLERIQTKH
ncbi:hypothetical protein KGQ34_02485 [Patescibacteria group bacterium]|nr:hypothetical protein [Patescibacteria group bacterium]